MWLNVFIVVRTSFSSRSNCQLIQTPVFTGRPALGSRRSSVLRIGAPKGGKCPGKPKNRDPPPACRLGTLWPLMLIPGEDTCKKQ